MQNKKKEKIKLEMAISKVRARIYEEDNEDIYCWECSDILEPEEAYTCPDCNNEFCKLHIKKHSC